MEELISSSSTNISQEQRRLFDHARGNVHLQLSKWPKLALDSLGLDVDATILQCKAMTCYELCFVEDDDMRHKDDDNNNNNNDNNRRVCVFFRNVIQYNTIQYNTLQYNTIQYNTIPYQYNTIPYQYNTIQQQQHHHHHPT